jgi:hypothetical protein
VDVDLDGQPHLLEGLRLLLLLLLPLALVELVLVLAVVEDPTHRRDRRGRNLHQVEPLLLGQGECLGGGHDAQLLPFVVDDAHLADADHLVDAEVSCDLGGSPTNEQNGHRPDTDGWPNVRETPGDLTPMPKTRSTRRGHRDGISSS